MPRLLADRDVCSCYGNCVVAAPDFYEIDDGGIVVLLREEIEEAERGPAEEAVANCPVDALSIEDDS